VTEPSLAGVLALRAAGQSAKALALAEQLVAQQPASVDALNLAGVLHSEQETLERGSELLGHLVRVEPHRDQAWLNLARAHRRLGRHRAAYDLVQYALILSPGDQSATALAATCVNHPELSSLGLEVTQRICRRARSIDPESAEAAILEARVFKRVGAWESALRLGLEAMVLAPADPIALIFAAGVFAESASSSQACRLYSWAWQVQPKSHDVPYWLSQIQLRQGDFDSGWRNYEHRWLSSIGIAQAREAAPIRASRPAYDGHRPGRRVLVWAEQGLGDEIMFGRLLAEFRPFCDRLLVQLDPRLVSLFSRVMPEVEFHGFDSPLPIERYDEQIPLGNLGGLLRPTRQSFFGKGGAYLLPKRDLPASLRADLKVPAGERLIGVSWLSANPDTGASRSLALEAVLRELQRDGIRLLNLQYGRVRPQIDAAREVTGINLLQHPDIDLTRDIEGLAGLIACCDLVVSVGNATAHLSGALGQKTWVLLPQVAGWRWMEEGDRCPWYDSLRLFRQTRRGDWAGVLASVRAALDTEIAV
jgi:tetratricopeptide (TPR) repeat protein